MKVTVENKKGLQKDLKIFIDKETISGHLNQKYDEIKKDVVLKGFRPGKVPTEVLKRQFGKAVYGEVIDQVLKDTTTKVLEEKKIKPAGQPKIDLKTFGEGKDLEYVITVTELPSIELSSFNKIKLDEYVVKINPKETDKRIQQIGKSQKNFVDVDPAKVANEGDLVIFDYKATVDGNDFKGSEGKNTQLELGKDLFIKGFDKQLLKVKKNEDVDVEVNLPENFPEKSLVGKKAIFKCKIISVKKAKPLEINDEFAKNLGVNVFFDQSSSSFNETVNRAGAGDFDIAIGKLSTNYSRMSNAHPHIYMNFRQSLLANRSFLSKFSNVPEQNLGSEILQSNIKVGFISNSSYETSAKELMPYAIKKGFSTWDECKEALINGTIDAIYRDATEIKKIVYQDPNLSIKFVPVLFDDVKDKISIYLSTDANTGLSDVLEYYLGEEEIKTDTQILNEFSNYYKPILSKK